MKRETDFIMNGDRYQFDWGECSTANGYAQVDTKQDAWYYGTWANPETFTIVSYAEGSSERIASAIEIPRDPPDCRRRPRVC